MSIAVRVLLSRPASDWATLFDNVPKECICTFIRDYRQFFTDEEQALIDLGKGYPSTCLDLDESIDAVWDLRRYSPRFDFSLFPLKRM
jgi:hypothetical protein